MRDFQDAVMVRLLRCLWHYGDFPIDSVQMAFELSDPSDPQSPLRRLMVDGVVWSLRNGDIYMDHIIDLFDIGGFGPAFNAAHTREDRRWWKTLQRRRRIYMTMTISEG